MSDVYEVKAYYQTSRSWKIKAKTREDAIEKADRKAQQQGLDATHFWVAKEQHRNDDA